MKLIKTIKTVFNEIYVYEKDGKLVAFKPSKNVENEILVNKLAKLFGIKILNIQLFKINNEEGILMDYLEDSKLLMDKKLNKKQIDQLKKIILFDVWIGNKDRHTANIFVNDDLIVFDHEKVFCNVDGRKCIKLDVGSKLNKEYVDIIEKLLSKNLTVKEVLVKVGFMEEDFFKVKEEDIKRLVNDEELLEFLVLRKDFEFKF